MLRLRVFWPTQACTIPQAGSLQFGTRQGVCVEITQLESICHNQIVWTTNLPFSYGKQILLLSSTWRRRFSIGESTELVGLSMVGRFACLWCGDDRVTGLDLMADFATATVDGVVCGCVSVRNKQKIFRKLLPRSNHSSGNITRRPNNYSTSFHVFLTFAGLRPRVLRKRPSDLRISG